ncbi:hypothetical protein NESM_000208300 [Novymonas esmeraldas]|uniref:Uncharacterized protein n=1 Tax=Novymonas esmeraldas TaxID=1808958 RepID=A0AAW0F8F3_9TRYP
MAERLSADAVMPAAEFEFFAGASVSSLPAHTTPNARASRRRLVHVDGDAAVLSTTAVSTEGARQHPPAPDDSESTILSFLRSSDAAPLSATKAARRSTLRAGDASGQAGGSRSPLLAAAAATRSPVHRTAAEQGQHLRERPLPLTIGGGSGTADEDASPLGSAGAGYRSRTSSVVVLETTLQHQPAPTPSNTCMATPHGRPPGARGPRSSPQHTPMTHGPAGTPMQLVRQVSWRAGGGGGSQAAFHAGHAAAGASTAAARVTAVVNTTPSIFPTSYWIRSAIDGTAVRPRRLTETLSSSPTPSSTPPPPPTTTTATAGAAGAAAATAASLMPRRDSVTALATEAAAQLHERRVAAALQSQREMREFTAIMRRVEVEGGARAVRQLQLRRRRHVWPAAGAGMRVSTGSGGGGRPGQTHQRPRRETSGASGSGGGGDGAEDEAGSVSDIISDGSALEDDVDDDEDDAVGGAAAAAAATSASAIAPGRGGSAAVSTQSRSPHLQHRGGGAAVPTGTSAAAAAEVAAAEGMSRAALYRLRDRTARGWVALQRRRVAHMRAGMPMLEQQLQASQQRLLRVHNSVLPKLSSHAAPVRGVAATAAALDGRGGFMLDADGAAVQLGLTPTQDLSCLTVSWGAVPDGGRHSQGREASPLLGGYASNASVAQSTPQHSRSGGGSGSGGGLEGGGVEEGPDGHGGAARTRVRVPPRRGRDGSGDADPLSVGTASPVADATTPFSAAASLTPPSSPGSNVTTNAGSPISMGTTAVQQHHHHRGVVSLAPVGNSDNRTSAADTAASSAAAGVVVAAAAVAAAEELALRHELQRLLALANECTLYGLHRSLRGTTATHASTSGSATAITTAAAAATTTPHAETQAPLAVSKDSRRHSRLRDAPPSGGELGTSTSMLSPTATAAAAAATVPASLPLVANSGTPAPGRPAASSRKRNNAHFIKSKNPRRHQPLPAVAGVGEHAAVLLQHELLVTRRWELDADQAHTRDISSTCAMLQRLRPLREQLMERDMSHAAARQRPPARRITAEPADPMLLTSGPVAGTLPNIPRDAAPATTLPSPSVQPRRTPADSAAARSHLPQAVLQRHRQLVYEEAVRLDAADQLAARTAYLDVLTRLAQRHVSTVSWPAVSSLLQEARGRLQREAMLAIGAPADAVTPAAAAATAVAARARSSSASTTASVSPTRRGVRTAAAAASTAVRAPSLLPPPPPPQSTGAMQPYGGLQQLLATHLGVLELTQWPVQEVLQHLAALHHVPLSLLHEWMAEQQRRYSHSYNYEERFRAVDRTIVGRTVAADTMLRLTLYRCRRPPLAPPPQGAAPAASAAAAPMDELYYIRVRSSVQSVASTAVPLSSPAASAASAASAAAAAAASVSASFAGSAASPRHASISNMDSAANSAAAAAAFLRSSSASPTALSAKALSFLGQTLLVSVRSAATAASRAKDLRRRTASKAALAYRSDGEVIDGELDDAVLALELMQAGAAAPLAYGELDLRGIGLATFSTGGPGGGRLRGQTVQVMLRRKGYRSAELKMSVELL